MHVLDHKGEDLSVRGPLNIARPVQGWPVIVQAGASDAGRQLAAETAEVVFAAGGPIADAQAFYADVKGRAATAGRDPDHIKILPGALVVVGDTVEEAKAKRAQLDSLVHYDSAIGSLSIALGVDARAFDPDGPLPEIPETKASKSGRERAIALARREDLTVRQLAQRLGGYAGAAIIGTPATIADKMEEWLETRACDGFNVMFPYLPAGLDDFVDQVVPELQRRGLFRTEYEGTTLRDNLGLPRPANRFFAAGGARRGIARRCAGGPRPARRPASGREQNPVHDVDHAVRAQQVRPDDAARGARGLRAGAHRLDARRGRRAADDADVDAAEHPHAAVARLDVGQAQPAGGDQVAQPAAPPSRIAGGGAAPGVVGGREDREGAGAGQHLDRGRRCAAPSGNPRGPAGCRGPP